jgi:peptidoglycan/LPS O-acetylase OafA/YrhL
MQNYFPNIRFHTWSLAVEEHFYLLLPMLLGAFSLGNAAAVRRWFLPVAVLVVCAIALLRCVHGILVPFTYETQMYPTHLRLDSLLMGVMLAHVATFFPGRFVKMQQHRRYFIASGIALVLPMFWLDLDRSLFVQTAGFSLLYLGYAAILIGALGTVPGRGIGGRLLTSPPGKVLSTIGLYSYGIYLWHIDLAVRPSVKLAAKLQMHLSPTLTTVAALCCCIFLACVVGTVMTYLVERPALALRDWLVPGDGQSKRSTKKRQPEMVALELHKQAIRSFGRRGFRGSTVERTPTVGQPGVFTAETEAGKSA